MTPTYYLSTSRAQLVFCLPSEQVTKRRYKLRVILASNNDTYDVTPGERAFFPLKYGSGLYRFVLYEQTYGNRYVEVWSAQHSVELENPHACFLFPNQYVNYKDDSDVSVTARRICEGKSKGEAYRTICEYVSRNFAYDFIKAVKKPRSVLPDIDSTMKKHIGVCQDLAALTVAMMRSVGIESRLVIGYADGRYHAWTESVVDEVRKRFDPSVAVYGVSKPKAYTAERAY